MKLRESGMPEEAYWETLFDVELILDRLGIDHHFRDVVELGCGYGTFTLPVAQRVGGVVRSLDIEPEMVARTRQRAVKAKLANVVCEGRDVFDEGFGVSDESQDACLLFNILHCEDPIRLLAEGARVVRSGGKVLVIHWRYDPATPRGPSMEIRPKPEQILKWAEQTGLLTAQGPVMALPPWHYGIRFRKSRARGSPQP